MAYIYVASSWRNPIHPEVVGRLRIEGHVVYNFRNPELGNNGFHWSEIDPEWKRWTKKQLRDRLSHAFAEIGYRKDREAMERAEVFVGVLPFGKSASIEMGWAAGRGKLTILLLDDGEPELMFKVFNHVCCSLDEVVEILKNWR